MQVLIAKETVEITTVVDEHSVEVATAQPSLNLHPWQSKHGMHIPSSIDTHTMQFASPHHLQPGGGPVPYREVGFGARDS